MKAVCAVIVTFNRKEYLKQTLEGLQRQTYPLKAILIYDNHSTDGTLQQLEDMGVLTFSGENTLHSKDVDGLTWLYYRDSENTGGAGGFHGGMKLATQIGFDYLWVMDDDVLPADDCLEVLMAHTSPECRICVPTRTDENNRDNAVIELELEDPFKGLVRKSVPSEEIEGDTVSVASVAFEGPLIATSVIREIGLPRKELFIFFDDTDFTLRANAVTTVLYCKTAVLHRLIIPKIDKTYLMNWRDYYNFRNQIWFYRTHGKNWAVRTLKPVVLVLPILLKARLKGKTANIKVLKKAYHDGVREMLGKRVEPGTAGKDF